MGSRKFNLRNSNVTDMGNIGMNQSLIYNDLRQSVQRMYSAFLLCQRVNEMPNSAFRKAQGFKCFLSLHHPSNRLQNIYFICPS